MSGHGVVEEVEELRADSLPLLHELPLQFSPSSRMRQRLRPMTARCDSSCLCCRPVVAMACRSDGPPVYVVVRSPFTGKRVLMSGDIRQPGEDRPCET